MADAFTDYVKNIDMNDSLIGKPKRILALDGGGVKGIISLAFLKRIEAELANRHNDPHFKLCDYFDLIGGTSTGAIIAAGLAIGMKVDELIALYMELGPRVFGEKRSWKRPWNWRALTRATFGAEGLTQLLKAVFRDISMAGEEIRTGLCIVIRRADNGARWLLTNREAHHLSLRNLRIPLWQAVRASTAAPTFFEPEIIHFLPDNGTGEAAFIDGGVSASNNPALAIFLMSVMKGGGFAWPTGEDKLLLVSVGTGSWARSFQPHEVLNNRLWNWASEVPQLLMEDISLQNQLVLQFLSNSPTAKFLDIKAGSLEGEILGSSRLLSYLRYDVDMKEHSLKQLGFDLAAGELMMLRDMSNAQNIPVLLEIARVASSAQVEGSHFPTSFDLW
jgi:uncharacterized protein